MEGSEYKEKWQSHFTKKIYRIKTIQDQMVVLEAINGPSQVYTTKENLRLFYTKLNNSDEERLKPDSGV